jgi:hypothetical protein
MWLRNVEPISSERLKFQKFAWEVYAKTVNLLGGSLSEGVSKTWTLAQPVQAQAPPLMVPLTQYVATMHANGGFEYVSERCAGLYTSFLKALEWSTDPKAAEARNIYTTKAETLLGWAMRAAVDKPNF